MPSLFAPELREHIRAFSAVVRLADQTADSPWLTRQDKLGRLDTLMAAIDGRAAATWSDEAFRSTEALRLSLAETGVSSRHIKRILAAFRRDLAEDAPPRTWAELLARGREAAAPLGHHMLELLGEERNACEPAADALCIGLRILKRLRDCRDVTRQFNRLCIPTQFMDDALVSIQHLRAPSAKGQTRAVLDRVLDGVDRLLEDAEPLIHLVRTPGLKLHVAVVLCRGRKLAARFRVEDPLQGRVELSGWERLKCRWGVIVRFMLGRL
ncbi:MAG: squalene synthase [Rhodospirillales bacterium]|nr:MAG: squalene synthase [Rhodospirillales bacterium]